jgi:hypothetical protein
MFRAAAEAEGEPGEGGGGGRSPGQAAMLDQFLPAKSSPNVDDG